MALTIETEVLLKQEKHLKGNILDEEQNIKELVEEIKGARQRKELFIVQLNNIQVDLEERKVKKY